MLPFLTRYFLPVIALTLFYPQFSFIFQGERASQIPHPQPVTTDQQDLEVKIINLNSSPDWIQGEVVYRNRGNLSMWIMTEPYQANGTLEPFYLAFDESQLTMELFIAVEFGPVDYCIYRNQARVRMALLQPGEGKRISFKYYFPLAKTMPPYRHSTERATFSLKKLKYVRACIGAIPDSKAVRQAAKQKYIPYVISGFESIKTSYRRKVYFFELQKMYYSPQYHLF